MNDVHTVGNQCRNNTAHHPRTAQSTDYQQYNQCRGYTLDISDYIVFEFLPFHFVEKHTNQHTYRTDNQKNYLTRTVQGITAESADSKIKQYHHYHNGYKRHQR